MKYCIFGGAFDPPHEGHRYLARIACETLGLDGLIWVPTPDPPHKSRPSTPFKHRLAMVKSFAATQPKQQVSDIESRLSCPSYSLHSIRALKAEYGREHTWYFLIGADNWAIFPTWYLHQEIMQEVILVVFPRTGYTVDHFPKGVLKLDMQEMGVQSSQIRQSLALTRDLTNANVPDEVRAYIQLNHLYGVDSPI